MATDPETTISQVRDLLKDAPSETLEAVRQYCTDQIEHHAAERRDKQDPEAAATPPAETASHGPVTPKQ